MLNYFTGREMWCPCAYHITSHVNVQVQWEDHTSHIFPPSPFLDSQHWATEILHAWSTQWPSHLPFSFYVAMKATERFLLLGCCSQGALLTHLPLCSCLSWVSGHFLYIDSFNWAPDAFWLCQFSAVISTPGCSDDSVGSMPK